MSASPDRPVYRHAEHAGNFADIHKHAVLAWIAASLADGGTPFCVLDTHAGDGIYPPDDAHLRTVQSVGGARNAPQALQPYLRVLHGAAGAHRPGAYPGSPWLLRALMGARDRLVLCENDPAACRTLRELFGGDNRVTVLEADGWARLRRWPPAGCRRGLLLTDPPYTGEGDYRVAPRRLAAAARRWPEGICCLWYPLADGPHKAMLAQLWSLCAGPALQAELWVEPPAGRSRMTGSGLFVMRPPAGLEAALDAIQPWLQARLARRPGGGTRVCRRPGA